MEDNAECDPACAAVNIGSSQCALCVYKFDTTCKRLGGCVNAVYLLREVLVELFISHMHCIRLKYSPFVRVVNLKDYLFDLSTNLVLFPRNNLVG